MNNKVLVAYASRLGSTAEVAQAIAQTLIDAGEIVDLAAIQSVKSIEGYQFVMVGSAIRYGRWLPDAIDFVTTYKTQLNHIPTAFFTVCMTLAEDTTANRLKAQAFLDPVRALVTPLDEGWFAGKLDYDQLTFMQRVIGKIQKLPGGDFRQWDRIQDWVRYIP